MLQLTVNVMRFHLASILFQLPLRPQDDDPATPVGDGVTIDNANTEKSNDYKTNVECSGEYDVE